MTNPLDGVYQQISAVCPISSLTADLNINKSQWRIAFDPVATLAQRAAAQSIIDGLDVAALQQAQSTRDAAISSDPRRVDLLNRLRTATPAQISNYIDNNVTDLAGVRSILKAILIVLSN